MSGSGPERGDTPGPEGGPVTRFSLDREQADALAEGRWGAGSATPKS